MFTSGIVTRTHYLHIVESFGVYPTLPHEWEYCGILESSGKWAVFGRFMDGESEPWRGQRLVPSHKEGSGPETVEKHLIVLVKFQIIKMRKLAVLVLQKLFNPINNCTKRTSQAYRDESECTKVCKMYSHTWLHFLFQNTPHFTGMETEAKKGQLTYQKPSRQGNQTSHFQSKHLFYPTILLLSDVRAFYCSLSKPQIQVCLTGMRIMIREI